MNVELLKTVHNELGWQGVADCIDDVIAKMKEGSPSLLDGKAESFIPGFDGLFIVGLGVIECAECDEQSHVACAHVLELIKELYGNGVVAEEVVEDGFDWRNVLSKLLENATATLEFYLDPKRAPFLVDDDEKKWRQRADVALQAIRVFKSYPD